MLFNKGANNTAIAVLLKFQVSNSKTKVMPKLLNPSTSQLIDFIKKTGRKTCVSPPAHVKTST
ncbi:hypothetical protein A7A78_13370 [Aequorivita soesokkakensis]|uniref:Uncharacterized protein n=1 Tax=Aequorivita soesokkakensis TaxID=1385699 RepID=A0A1A9LD90_9FLAO|nr:hypothetical protein [Aequorivita soesokkakensis]OAD90934.1 hypothetical protein A7A78_13370 [Aequorivita soesokkakensis]